MVHRIRVNLKCGRWIGVAACLATLGLGHTAAAQPLVGDCNGDGAVTVDELVTGVGIALVSVPLAVCMGLDTNGDGQVTVEELVAAVHNALTSAPQSVAFVIATDFSTGSFGTIRLDPPRTVEPASASRSVGSDAVSRPYGGLVYVVNRFGSDNIQVLDPSRGFATTVQCSTGAGSNPNDIAFASRTKAYVPLYGSAQLLVVNPSARPDCSDFVVDSVDLSAFADADGIPEMSQAVVVGDRAYVSVQRLANFVPAQRGALAVIDTTTDQVLDGIDLTGANPFSQTKGLLLSGGTLVVSEVGVLGVNDGGIERVDLATGMAQGFFITEATIGGDVTDFVLVSDQLAYAIISKSDFSTATALVAFNPDTGGDVRTIAGGNFADIELNDRGELFLADRTAGRPGIRIFRASDGVELTTAPIDLGLQPFDIVFLR